MRILRPYEFHDEQEIISFLSQKKLNLAEWFNKRIDSLDEIVWQSVGRNTFRAFHNMPERPSLVFRDWASRGLGAAKTRSELVGIRSKKEYSDWLSNFSLGLSRHWRGRMGVPLPYGPSRKLPNLLLKTFVLWVDLSDQQRNRLIRFLHVPLDSYTLIGLRRCIGDLGIPKTATMSFVADIISYDRIQKLIRDLANEADVPPIYYDVLAWDMRH